MSASPRTRHLASSSLVFLLTTGGACERSAATASPDGRERLPAPIFADRQDKNCGSYRGVGQQLEDFELPGLAAGETLRISDFRGRVVLLNFWGSWCAPCLEELPEFSTLYRAYRDHGLSLVAVATDEDPNAVVEVARHHQLTAHFAIAGEEVAQRQGEHDFPFTYLIDPTGKIDAAWDGYEATCLGHIEDKVRRLLAAQSPEAPAH